MEDFQRSMDGERVDVCDGSVVLVKLEEVRDAEGDEDGECASCEQSPATAERECAGEGGSCESDA